MYTVLQLYTINGQRRAIKRLSLAALFFAPAKIAFKMLLSFVIIVSIKPSNSTLINNGRLPRSDILTTLFWARISSSWFYAHFAVPHSKYSVIEASYWFK